MDKNSKHENYVDVNRKGENGTETDENLKENQKEDLKCLGNKSGESQAKQIYHGNNAAICIAEILKEHSSENHKLTQKDIADFLLKEYRITRERKAISRDLTALANDIYKGIIFKTDKGSYYKDGIFEKEELKLMIDSIIGSSFIPDKEAKNLIDKLCSLTNKEVCEEIQETRITQIHSVDNTTGDSDRLTTSQLFENIKKVEEAIKNNKKITYEFHKFRLIKKSNNPLRWRAKQEKTARNWTVSPYGLVVKNQRYYLICSYESDDGACYKMSFQRLDRIKELFITEEPRTKLEDVKDYENGKIEYKLFKTAYPYMYAEKPQEVVFIAKADILDDVIDKFGKKVEISEVAPDASQFKVKHTVSLHAMKYWALQYIDAVEILEPPELRKMVEKSLNDGIAKYNHN